MKYKNWPKNLLIHSFFWPVVLIVIILPDLRRISYTPGDSFYPLIHKIHEDYYGYLSYIKQGRSQNYIINQYTTADLPPSYLHNYYLFLGRLGKIFSLSDIYMYRIGLYFPLLLYCLYSYCLVSFLIPSKYKWPALFIIFFASPFPDKMVTILGRDFNFKAEWWTGLDAYSRLTMKPHHFMSTSLMLASTFYFLKYLKGRNLRDLIYTGFLMLPAMIFFAMPAFILFCALSAVLGFYLVTRKPKIRESLVIIIIFLSSIASLIFVNWEAKKINLVTWESVRLNSPQDSLLKLTYRFFLPLGILPVFFIPAVFYIREKRKPKYIFPMLIVAIAYLLFILSAKGIVPLPMIRLVYYAPYVFGGLLATMGLIYVTEKINSTAWKRAALSGITILLITNAFFGLQSYWWPELFKKEIFINTYIPKPYLQAMDYLKLNTKQYSNVMSTFYTGMFIPAFTYNKVYIGHEAVPADFPTVWWTAENFMSGQFSQDEARRILSENRILYVFWDQGNLPPAYAELMQPLYKHEYVTIYKTTL
ncbi:hypothetical protein A3J20_04610 [Candidatus Gottesmanbacteria bacterium RIFCSPLOWO2_02_FULL_42_29]|uniref:Glycosyltransferase RgtA/B/C/D-like domain-containing protein n=2 Tax=Candidatus Gottesmaniibacteriota TaxID=1752720 RepID=A0A1F6B8Y9_9BACT|nr:MAG: hypothetical protein UV09_C0008G0019 [Candidatus Gottesmanbacteria bacterium GW2011_GWA2_42_18]KKS75297.1 MAG: hypothetical protein UV46_C0021G0013 [Candidatus Gottesmanbacteria bacterium GW2011_GWC2_42_8]OGG09761.1 MAG: hypothetical protein A2781_05540 [Candidatus Gottesmanbacteria bacterium RIFCSPHIGHO2_01_FULL_42_27]OGG20169.1 MAG: hypothetical protein A3E72_01265 [Candidatus Gottesmanbacteria bacterium RIFCSPHIGHO2_12_FULL_43_26]OGG33385.1 MAG: hypothetical protein A2968_01160 [Cand